MRRPAGGVSLTQQRSVVCAAPAAPAGGGAKVTNVYLDGRLLDVDGRVARKLEEFVDAVDAAYNMGKAVRA